MSSGTIVFTVADRFRRVQESPWSVVWLTGVWLALWRDLSWANLLSGILAAVGILLLFPLPAPVGGIRIRPVPMLRFLAIFGSSVIRANLVVAWEVLTPRNRIREAIIGVPLRTDHPVVVTVVNHAINLAPGTMVVDIDDDPTVVYVHVLRLEEPDDVHAEVRQLETLTLAAFGLEPVREVA